MYIDKYNIEVIGQEYNSKKEKYINDLTKVTLKSTDGMHYKKFIPMLDELFDAHEGCRLEFDVKIRQHQYDD
jgi:hypothetical protein|tara:strand:+ start:2213 stop:2428 length:216 start_codon:yes stop_codon:yes gene_type:complete